MEKQLKDLMMDRIFSMKDRANWDNCLELSYKSLEELGKKYDFSKLERVYLIGCGTSMANAMIGESLIEEIAHIPAKGAPAFSFTTYTDESLLNDKTLVLGISGKGVTSSVEAGLEFARKAGAITIAVTGGTEEKCAAAAGGNVIEVIFDEGPTVRTTSNIHLQLGLFATAVVLGEAKGVIDAEKRKYWDNQMETVINYVDDVLALRENVTEIAKKYDALKGEMVIFMGAGPNHGTAWEASLMAVEMSWIDSAGYELEEFTHGRFRECDERKPMVFISPYGKSYVKLLSILTACKKAGAPVVILTDNVTDEIKELAQDIIQMPSGIDEVLTPFLYVFPLWFFDYATGEIRNVDPAGVRYGITAVDINRTSI